MNIDVNANQYLTFQALADQSTKLKMSKRPPNSTTKSEFETRSEELNLVAVATILKSN